MRRFAMSYSSSHRAFPKFLVTLALFLLSAGAIVLFAYLPSEDTVLWWFRTLGEFICRYDTVLIGILLVVNLVEFIDLVVFAKRDEVINKTFEMATRKNISFFALFKHYFLGMYCRGPLIYATQERSSSLPRMLITFITNTIKFVFWFVLMVTAAGTILKPAVYDFSMAEGVDYNFTMLVLLLFLNCNIFLFALYRILPLHEGRSYKVTEYYSDGSSQSYTSHTSNFVAILILSAILYGFYTSYFIFPYSSKIVRCIETLRFNKYVDESRYNECIRDFYS